MRSTGIFPCMRKSTSVGMNSCGWLSPWITPRTTRPNCRNGISNDTSVPLRALPSRTQVPGRHQRLDRFAEDRGLRRGLEGEAHAVAIDLADVRDHVGAAFVIDHVRGAERPRQRQSRIVHVDGNDRVASGYFGRHQSGQADGAHSEYGKRISGPWSHRVEHGAGAGLSAAREWAKELERSILPDFDHVAFVGDRMSGEGGLLEEGAVDRHAAL